MSASLLQMPGEQRQTGIVVTLHWSEIARLAADRTGPTAFNQYLLERFKAAGAPVEGVIQLKLACGAIARVKPRLDDEDGVFRYVWLTEVQAAEQRLAEKQADDIARWNARRN
jgi:hypothetical protein